MTHPEIVEIEHGMILDLEQDLARAKRSRRYWWKKWQTVNDAVQGWMNHWRNAEDRVIKLERRLEKSQKELQKMESLWRDHLEEGDPQDDNEWESRARQILKNQSDIEKEIAVNGYDKEDYVPF